RADYIGFRAVFQHNMADEQKPVRRCPAPAQRERFPKVMKHRADRFRTIRTACIKTVGHLQPSFPRGRESRPVGAETYREKRFLEILRPGFPLLWE
ncbi:TPA: hypothetical protein ACKWXT_002216, partial [Neisseria gonorrhoeae]